MFRFELTHESGFDHALKITTMDGVDIIVCFHVLKNDYMFAGCKINGIGFESEDETKGLFVRIGKRFVYNLHAVTEIIRLAAEQIESKVVGAAADEKREDEAEERWLASERSIYSRSVL